MHRGLFSWTESSFGRCGKHRGDADAVGTGTVVATAPKMLPLMLLSKTVRLFSVSLPLLLIKKKNNEVRSY